MYFVSHFDNKFKENGWKNIMGDILNCQGPKLNFANLYGLNQNMYYIPRM